MTSVAETITQKLRAAFPQGTVTVSDPMQDDTHLEALIVDASFAGKNRVQQHRMVYAALDDAFAKDLHALKMTTKSA